MTSRTTRRRCHCPAGSWIVPIRKIMKGESMDVILNRGNLKAAPIEMALAVHVVVGALDPARPVRSLWPDHPMRLPKPQIP